MKTKRQSAIGKWETMRVFKPAPGVSQQQIEDELHKQKVNEVTEMLGIGTFLAGARGMNRFAAAEEFQDYFPGRNKVPDGGGWILVKSPPPCEYTVPPLSIWFAEPWPMEHSKERHCSHRVKIMTPRGELGLFPREYSLIDNPEKYYEFIGDGMEIKFFGNNDTSIPPELAAKLFYIRSRGVSKADALAMLFGSIKAHSILWIESRPEVCGAFGMEWPHETRLATL